MVRNLTLDSSGNYTGKDLTSIFASILATLRRFVDRNLALDMFQSRSRFNVILSRPCVESIPAEFERSTMDSFRLFSSKSFRIGT